jgi:hypothetical protein
MSRWTALERKDLFRMTSISPEVTTNSKSEMFLEVPKVRLNQSAQNSNDE